MTEYELMATRNPALSFQYSHFCVHYKVAADTNWIHSLLGWRSQGKNYLRAAEADRAFVGPATNHEDKLLVITPDSRKMNFVSSPIHILKSQRNSWKPLWNKKSSGGNHSAFISIFSRLIDSVLTKYLSYF